VRDRVEVRGQRVGERRSSGVVDQKVDVGGGVRQRLDGVSVSEIKPQRHDTRMSRHRGGLTRCRIELGDTVREERCHKLLSEPAVRASDEWSAFGDVHLSCLPGRIAPLRCCAKPRFTHSLGEVL
jgi:hypothetical protein